MACRAARSLTVLRDEANVRWPARSKATDGFCASPQHSKQNPSSDHEPNKAGVARAFDLTEWNGIVDVTGEHLRATRDRRLKYWIHDRRMFSSYPTSKAAAWTWRPYTGSNPHTTHGHLSVLDDPALYDSAAPWGLNQGWIPMTVVYARHRSPEHAAWLGLSFAAFAAQTAGVTFTTDKAEASRAAKAGTTVYELGSTSDVAGSVKLKGDDGLATIVKVAQAVRAGL